MSGAKKMLVLLAVAAISVGIALHFKGSSDNPSDSASDLPPIRVDESTLSEKGLDFLAQLKERIKELEENPDNTILKCKEGLLIASNLRWLGDYRSAAEWFLKSVQWYDELPDEDKRTLYLSKDIPMISYTHAGICYYLDGRRKKALDTWSFYLKNYPNDGSPGRTAVEGYYRNVRANREPFKHNMGAMPKYLKR